MKVVINKCYGGFGLSQKALARLVELSGVQVVPYNESDDKRHTYGTVMYRGGMADYFSRSSGVAPEDYLWGYEPDRNDPQLVQVVQELGPEANGEHADLVIIEIPDDVHWEIEEYDGTEWVAEVHRTWR